MKNIIFPRLRGSYKKIDKRKKEGRKAEKYEKKRDRMNCHEVDQVDWPCTRLGPLSELRPHGWERGKQQGQRSKSSERRKRIA